MNDVLLVGKIASIGKLEKNDKNEDILKINIAVQRDYKNDKNMYDFDFFDIELKGLMAENVKNYCNSGNMISIKGSLETYYEIDNTKNKTKVQKYKIIAKEIRFLGK